VRVDEIRCGEQLQALKPAWEALLKESSSDTIFLTWEWVVAWWSAYGNQDDLYVLAAFDDNGALRGLAPLRREILRKYGQSIPTIRFACDGSNDSDYLDFIASAGYEKRVLEAFQGHWKNEMKRGSLLVLNEIPGTSPNLAVLQELAQSEGLLWTERDVPCGVVRLPRNWEEYLKSLRSRFRTKVRSVLRELEARPEIRFGFCNTEEEVHRLLPILFDLHTRRWATDGKPGVFGSDRKREFYCKLSPLLLKRGWLRFGWLEWSGRILACQYGFAYRNKYFLLQEGYEPASEHWNLGIALRAWSIREFIRQGLDEYDFLGGSVARHRSDWGAGPKNSKHVRLGALSYKNILFCRGPEWVTGIREAVRAVLPQKVLAVRQKMLERPSPSHPKINGQGHDLLRTAASYVYLYSGMPALTKPLLDRYSLLISRNGRLPRIACQKRTEPTAHILYFHRINNDLDPFFPATTTKLFSECMRFMARSKKVVSLNDLVTHLDGDSTEPVFAITFDDGYRDNYENAFPILQNLGLPATIFLTTGSMDSREPLWFEQLAFALKSTAREFIDVEVDLPRRLFLRTKAERLQANHQIFSVLRGFPDAERRRLLAQILQQLGVSGDGDRCNKMLTWDQVRHMKSRGIEFGGHTVTHPFISKLSRESIFREVSDCKRRIEEELQSPSDFFAYPNGREADFDSGNKELIRNVGYRAAVTTIWGTNYRSTDRMELRRGAPWETRSALFAYKLDWYQFVDG
jgi:peptidoglycan/xylan/chitin deacetylase (PgdA/CDA1 family)/CelD/BcsL family acetyltransferase involved in cellulose biosynthesis